MIIKRSTEDNTACYVTGVCWERIRLRLSIRIACTDPDGITGADALQFYIVNKKSGRCAGVFESTHIRGDRAELVFLITNRGDNRCLDPGEYVIISCRGDKDNLRYLSTLRSDPGVVNTDDAQATFPFHRKKWYKAECTETDDKTFTLKITVYNGRMTLKRRLSEIKKACLQLDYDLSRLVFCISRKKRVLLLCDLAEKPGQNLIAVRDRMLREGYDKKRLTFAAVNPVGMKKSIKDDLKLVSLLASHRTVVVDEHIAMLDWLNPGKDLKLIQLWHAGVGFKATGYSRWGHAGAISPMSSHRYITYGTVSSMKVRSIFSELWGISDEQAIPCGIPKMDKLADKAFTVKKKAELLEKYPLCHDRRVMLFAPTYRGRGKKDATYPLDKLNLVTLGAAARDGGWAVLIKLHPWVKQKPVIPAELADIIADASDTPIEELFTITDLLITDYSSALFEYSYLRRPMLFYAFDEEEYGMIRGFHRPYRKNAPGKVVNDFNSLIKAIRNEDFETEKLDEYVERHFDIVDSDSSLRVINWLIKGNLPKEYADALKKHNEYVSYWTSLSFDLQS